MTVALRLQPRDIDFLRYLAHRGLADAPSVKDAVFATCGDRAFRRRMALLASAGFVHRLSIGEYFANSGVPPVSVQSFWRSLSRGREPGVAGAQAASERSASVSR